MMRRFIYSILVSCLLGPTVSFADDLSIAGATQHQIPTIRANSEHPDGMQEITVLEYDIPEQMREQMYQQVHRRLEQQGILKQDNSSLPKKVQLGMGNVPVLDQGQHGTCTAFALTAAIDALLGNSDYVSQLCLLQLGKYFEDNDGSMQSGWEGASYGGLLRRIEQYGVMSKYNQHRHGCGNYYLYPYFSTPSTGMPPEQYALYHEFPLKQHITWQYLLRIKGLQSDPRVVQKIKTALHQGSRVLIGAFLPRSDLGTMGATGKYRTYHYFDDTWVLTHAIEQDILYTEQQTTHEY